MSASLVLGASSLTTFGIGVIVFLTNPNRQQNRALFLLCFNLAGWAGCVLGAVTANTVEETLWYIRVAALVGFFVPLHLHFLCLAIEHSEKPLGWILSRLQRHLLFTVTVSLVSLTPLYVSGVELVWLDDVSRFPMVKPGRLYTAFNLLILLRVVALLGEYLWKTRRLDGIRKAELQYIMLGMSATALSTALFLVVLPQLTPGQDTRAYEPYAPLGLLAMSGILAYGIATQRLLNVSTVLRRALAYGMLMIYLVTLYAAIYFLSNRWLTSLLGGSSDTVPHVLAALTLAFSMTPAQGVLQRFSQKLFINRHSLGIEEAVKSGSSLFASITTIDTLVERFRNITLTAGIDAESLRVMLPKGDQFIEYLPEEARQAARQLQPNAPLVRSLRTDRAPIAAYALKRARATPLVTGIAKDLAEIDAELALGLYFKNDLRGVVSLGARRSGRIYSATEQDSLQVLCNQLAIALENAQLYTEVQNNKVYNDILVDNLVSGLIAANQEGVVTIINREAQRIAEVTAPRAIGSRLDVLPPPFAAALRETLQHARSLKEKEVVIERDRGEPVPVRLGSSPFYSSTGEPLGALLVFADLTEQRKLESQVRRSDRLASVGTLSAGMAHEIKNPLVTIKTFTELLPDRYQDAEFRETFSCLVSQEVLRIDRLVNQLLHFARPAPADLRPASLHITLKQALMLIEEQLNRKRIRLELLLSDAGDSIRADNNLLTQALINLLFNAIDSMESGGRLVVETWSTSLPWPLRERVETDEPEDRPYLCLAIRDSGSGIPEDALGQIFDPFYSTKHHGTGLGLAISHGIIKEHHALIEVESQVGVGSSFLVYFPLEAHGVAV